MVQPCGDHLKACNGAVCKVGSDKNNKNTISLGALTDVKFDQSDGGLKVRYTQVRSLVLFSFDYIFRFFRLYMLLPFPKSALGPCPMLYNTVL